MKVVGIVGSPRKGSNSEILVREALEAAKLRGAEIEMFKINEMNVKWCQGCFYCQKHGVCRQQDDMQEIYSAIEGAEAIVIGTPIYMGYVTAQTKTFLDRLFALMNVFRGESKLKGKKVALIYSQGRGQDGMEVMKAIGERLSNIGMQIVGIVGGNGMNEERAVEKRDDLLEAARKLGAELV